jgi:hypothetical protein
MSDITDAGNCPLEGFPLLVIAFRKQMTLGESERRPLRWPRAVRDAPLSAFPSVRKSLVPEK